MFLKEASFVVDKKKKHFKGAGVQKAVGLTEVCSFFSTLQTEARTKILHFTCRNKRNDNYWSPALGRYRHYKR